MPRARCPRPYFCKETAYGVTGPFKTLFPIAQTENALCRSGGSGRSHRAVTASLIAWPRETLLRSRPACLKLHSKQGEGGRGRAVRGRRPGRRFLSSLFLPTVSVASASHSPLPIPGTQCSGWAMQAALSSSDMRAAAGQASAMPAGSRNSYPVARRGRASIRTFAKKKGKSPKVSGAHCYLPQLHCTRSQVSQHQKHS